MLSDPQAPKYAEQREAKPSNDVRQREARPNTSEDPQPDSGRRRKALQRTLFEEAEPLPGATASCPNNVLRARRRNQSMHADVVLSAVPRENCSLAVGNRTLCDVAVRRGSILYSWFLRNRKSRR